MKNISDALRLELNRLTEEADSLTMEERYPQAIAKYQEAWQLLPEPRESAEAAPWLLASIGDAYTLAEEYSEGRSYLERAMACPKAIDNPFHHLRLGQCLYELGDKEASARELLLAYKGEGEDIFEDEDPLYLDFIRPLLRKR